MDKCLTYPNPLPLNRISPSLERNRELWSNNLEHLISFHDKYRSDPQLPSDAVIVLEPAIPTEQFTVCPTNTKSEWFFDSHDLTYRRLEGRSSSFSNTKTTTPSTRIPPLHLHPGSETFEDLTTRVRASSDPPTYEPRECHDDRKWYMHQRRMTSIAEEKFEPWSMPHLGDCRRFSTQAGTIPTAKHDRDLSAPL